MNTHRFALAAEDATVRHDVVTIEPNVVHHLQRFANLTDPMLSRQWHLNAPKAGLDLRRGA